jgi:outer membrane protein OmpU
LEKKMKRILATTAIAALALGMAAPAHAQLQLGVAGHFKGYVSWDDQDTQTGYAGYSKTTPASLVLVAPGHDINNLSGASAGSEARTVDIIRDTEVHFTGETTLDNGLTVGVHVEADADAGDSFEVDESYAYFSGAWGRSNFGDEDGAAYLLQVAAPSADSNIDGLRQSVNPVNYVLTDLNGIIGRNHLNGAPTGAGAQNGELDYANDATRHADKLTYLTPVFSGFQAGVSYTPNDHTSNSREFGNSIVNGTVGNGAPVNNTIGDAWEGAARWEGTFNNVGLNLGGGYTWVNREDRTAQPANRDFALDNFKQWNLGADVNVSAFGLGVIYTQNNQAMTNNNEKTWVGGGDYTTGPFKLGVSWLNDKMDGVGPGSTTNLSTGVVTFGDVKTNRYSGGVVYTFAPGMSFRGSVGVLRTDGGDGTIATTGTHNSTGVPDVDAVYGLLGTQINF